MAIGILDHAGYFSYQSATDELAEYYTTASADEEILFTDNGVSRHLNSVLIENTGSATMCIRPRIREAYSPYACVIPAGESRNLDYVEVTGFKVLGASAQTLRYSGLYW
jgi:hypothetical protein